MNEQDKHAHVKTLQSLQKDINFLNKAKKDNPSLEKTIENLRNSQDKLYAALSYHGVSAEEVHKIIMENSDQAIIKEIMQLQKSKDTLRQKLAEPNLTSEKIQLLEKRLTLATQHHTAAWDEVIGSLDKDRIIDSFTDRETKQIDTRWVAICLDVAHKSFRYEYGDLSSMTMFVQCTPHVFQIIRHLESMSADNFEDYDIQREKIAWLYIEAGRGFGYDGDYDDALKYLHKALDIRKVLGENHPDTAAAYHNIGRVYSRKGDYAKAKHKFGKALIYRKNVLGNDSFETAESCHDLARVYARRNNPKKDRVDEYKRALKWYERALKVRIKAEGRKRLYTAATYNGIAEVHARQGRYYEEMGKDIEARDYYRNALREYGQALKIDEDVVGKQHPLDAVTYYNIAEVLYFMKDYQKAELWYKTALDIRELVLGKDHPHTAATYAGFAKVYVAQKKYDTALDMYRKALIIYTKVSNVKDIAATHFWIGKIHHEEKRGEKAREHYHETLRLQKMLCETSLDVATTYFSIGASFYSSGKYQDAINNYRNALDIQKKSGTPAGIKQILESLANACHELGKYPEELDYDEEARNI